MVSINKEDLVYAVMEVGRSHNLFSANWRLRETSGAMHSEFEGLRTRGADDINPNLTEGKDEMRCRSSNSEAREKKGKFLLPLPFVLLTSSVDSMMLNHIGEGNLPY